jgi:hypothetical protein
MRIKTDGEMSIFIYQRQGGTAASLTTHQQSQHPSAKPIEPPIVPKNMAPHTDIICLLAQERVEWLDKNGPRH